MSASFIVMIISFIPVLGVIGFFTNDLLLVLIGGIIGLIENLGGIFTGNQRSTTSAIIACFIGAFYAASVGLPAWFGVFIGLCFESAIMTVAGILMGIINSKKNNA